MTNFTRSPLDPFEVSGSHARFRDFRNRLRILASIDMDELAAVGVLSHDPFRWFARVGNECAERLWQLIEKRSGTSAAPRAI